ncbi:hypothetical protein BMS3Abin10_00332 [bacterium BMS3Abin10]|nr:hypothetical protein BMS3Abin10_00332 [bacterium BMS3Abin10]GBE40119.1 hypothetical protein BMS3Bbin08_02757 [bacterium BMS3Bbin08]
MKSKIIITVNILVFLIIYTSYANDQPIQERTNALRTFDAIVEKFSTFFKTKPKYVSKEELIIPENPTGETYQVVEYHLVSVAYDIQKSNSLVSPFIGYIDVNRRLKNNASCGDVKVDYGIPGMEIVTYGWSKIEGALKNSDNKLCYGRLSGGTVERFIFAYQDKEWIFKDVVFKDTLKENRSLLAIFGLQSSDFIVITDPNGELFNAKWQYLIK